MLFRPYLVYGYMIMPLICFVISAKWTRELEFGLIWQLVAAICGFVLGPIMLLLLYIRGFWGPRGNAKPASLI